MVKATLPLTKISPILFSKVIKAAIIAYLVMYFFACLNGNRGTLHSPAFPLRYNGLTYGLLQFLELFFEPFRNGFPVDFENQFCFVRVAFQHMESCFFSCERAFVFLRIEFACILQRSAANECGCLSFIEADNPAKVFYFQYLFRQRKPSAQLIHKPCKP